MRVASLTALLFAAPVSAAPDFVPARSFLQDVVAEGLVAGGSVLVLHRGEVVFGEGFGLADLQSKTPFELDTPVVIASLSKPLLGTAAFRLAEKGALKLSTPISEHLPEFGNRTLESGVALRRAPSMIELFSHISGMRADASPGGRPWFATWTKGKPLSWVVERFARDMPFEDQPGSRYAYSGIGTDVAARVLEVVARRSRNDLFSAEVSEPLGMTRTYYRDAESIKLLGQMPTRYYRSKEGALLATWRRPLPAAGDYTASGGTILSTAPDLARWLLMIRNGGRHEGTTYLAPDSIAEMLASVPRGSNARGGLAIRKRNGAGKALVVGHTGSSGTDCWIDFENDIIGILLTQTEGSHIKAFRIAMEKRITEGIAEEDGTKR
jgi:CubicO group peptidase (beta-lactamase class C family)